MSSPATMPGPDEAVIHVHGAAGPIGPMSRRALKAEIDGGRVRRDDHVWIEGMTDWVAISAWTGLLDGLDVPAAPVAGESADDRLDRVFGQLVRSSWDYYNAHVHAGHIDEVFLGAIITSTLDTGYSLIDLTSDGTHHYLRFEHLGDHSRVIVRLTHLTGDLVRAKVQGHRASVIVGYGERSNDFAKIMNAIRAELKSGYIQSAEPGTITVDGDMNTGYVYVQVDLYLCVDDYVGADYTIRYDRLQEHLGATLNALRKYLRGRFGR